MKLAELHQRRIAAAVTLRETVSLARVLIEIEDAIERFRKEALEQWKWKTFEFVEGKNLIRRTRTYYASKGAPHKQAERNYIRELVVIYERATENRIRRNQPVDKPARRHPFIWACTRAAGTPYSHAFVKEAIKKLHPSQQRSSR